MTETTEMPPIKLMILGRSGMGKTYSLKNMKNPEGILHINGDRKNFPFLSPIKSITLDEPNELLSIMDQVEDSKYHTIVIDTFTSVLSDFEDMYIAEAARRDGFEQWANYQRFVRSVMTKMNNSIKNYIIMSHTMSHTYEDTKETVTQAAVKSNVKNASIEALATCVLYTKSIPVNQLKDNRFLTITEEDKEDGIKSVFQTRKDKRSRNESVKFIEGIFNRDELYVENDCQKVFDAIKIAQEKLLNN